LWVLSLSRLLTRRKIHQVTNHGPGIASNTWIYCSPKPLLQASQFNPLVQPKVGTSKPLAEKTINREQERKKLLTMRKKLDEG